MSCISSLLFNASQNHYSYCHLTIQSFKTYSTHYHCDGGPYVLQGAYGYLMEFLPKQYQFDDTENNKMIIKMFEINWLWPVLFLDIVIITPL